MIYVAALAALAWLSGLALGVALGRRPRTRRTERKHT